mgnify:CR=1 FL=1
MIKRHFTFHPDKYEQIYSIKKYEGIHSWFYSLAQVFFTCAAYYSNIQ